MAPDFDIADVWELRDGDYVTITNRMADLPPWFELQPDEACDRAAREMMKRLNEGFQPSGAVDGPHLWRLNAGDRLVWVRDSPGASDSPVKLVLEVRSSALAVVESNRPDFDPLDLMDIGEGTANPTTVQMRRTGYQAACALGAPRTVSTGPWGIGS
jgi:hypothetical protein